MESTMTEQQRAFEMSLDLAATPAEVWRALTEAEELVRWFPLQARVTPGAGGTMFWSWGDTGDWETRIDAWEPGRLLLESIPRQTCPCRGNSGPCAPGNGTSASNERPDRPQTPAIATANGRSGERA